MRGSTVERTVNYRAFGYTLFVLLKLPILIAVISYQLAVLPVEQYPPFQPLEYFRVFMRINFGGQLRCPERRVFGMRYFPARFALGVHAIISCNNRISALRFFATHLFQFFGFAFAVICKPYAYFHRDFYPFRFL